MASGHRARGYLLAIMAAACWASGGLTAKWMFERLPFPVDPVALSASRALVAFVVMLAWVGVTRRDRLKVTVRDLPFLGAFGVFGLALVHFTYFKTISLTNVATAILLEYLAPVLVLVVSVAFLGERLSWTLPAAVAMSVSGCALMVGAVGGEGLAVSAPGILWGLASALFFATYTLMGRWAAGRYSPWTMLTYGLAAASAFWIVYMGGIGPVILLLSEPVGLAAVTGMAIVSTVLPFVGFLTALHYIEATKASVTATLEPVMAGVAAYLLLGEVLSAAQLAGATLVLGAIVLVQAPGLVRSQLPPPT